MMQNDPLLKVTGCCFVVALNKLVRDLKWEKINIKISTPTPLTALFLRFD